MKLKRIYLLFFLLFLSITTTLTFAQERFITPSPPPFCNKIEKFYPLSIGNGPNDPFIPAPGMGWVAYPGEWNLAQNYNQLKGFFNTLTNNGCNYIYMAFTWKQWHEEINEITNFIDKINYFNENKNYNKKIKIIISVTFANTCDDDDIDYPICSTCCFPYLTDTFGNDILYTYFYYYNGCDNNNNDNVANPCCGKWVTEIKYWHPNAMDIIECFDEEIESFLVNHGENIVGIVAGFMGIWGENHLALYEIFKNEVSWNYFLDSIDDLFSEFASMANRHHLIKFFVCNPNWIESEGNPNMSKDMFNLAVSLGFNLKRCNTKIHFTNNPLENYYYDTFYNQFNNFTLLSKAGAFLEWADVNHPLTIEEFNSLHLNFCQLNYPTQPNSQNPIYQFGLESAIKSLSTDFFKAVKNKIGYRFKINYVFFLYNTRDLTHNKIIINITNLGNGLCPSDIKLEIVQPNSSIPIATKYISKNIISKLKKGTFINITFYDLFNTVHPNFWLKIYVKDIKTEKWINIPFSNYNSGEVGAFGEPIPAKNLKINF